MKTKAEELKNKIYELLRIHSVSFNEFKNELIAVPEDAFNDLTEDVFSEVTDFAEKEKQDVLKPIADYISKDPDKGAFIMWLCHYINNKLK
jgi:hypothetical protein